MKLKKAFLCSQCGASFLKWSGKCVECGAWNSIEEVEISSSISSSQNSSSAGLIRLSDVSTEKEPRLESSLKELDRVLGGGLVFGSFILVSGDPGIGKSTLLLQYMKSLALKGHSILYASGEESMGQIRLRGERLGAIDERIFLSQGTCLEALFGECLKLKPTLVVIDSIQTMALERIPSAAGSATQMRECASELMEFAKKNGISIILVGHVTKDGMIAGPKLLEHLVDTVLYLEGDSHMGFRILRAVKNRFGSTGEVGVFSMDSQGLKEVDNPSLLFVNLHKNTEPGTSIGVSMEGSRPFLLELQSLVGKSNFQNPRRLSTGFDPTRLSILIAVLEKRAGVFIGASDIYVSISGGLRVSEPALDLALCVSLMSSFLNRKMPYKCAFIGEIALTGEIRPVTNVISRMNEALKMGFEKVYLPRVNYIQDYEKLPVQVQKNLFDKVLPIEHVQEVASLFLK